jgi:hypothetical protein
MNCRLFGDWLDAGCPERDAADARRHARECDPCAAALGVALELEAAMIAAPAAPAGFTDRVMARVAETPQMSRSAFSAAAPVLPVLAPALPWWVRAAMEPAVLLAAVLAAVLVGWGSELARGANTAVVWLAGAVTSGVSQSAWAPLVDDPRVLIAMVIALTPSLLWTSRRLYALGNKLAG